MANSKFITTFLFVFFNVLSATSTTTHQIPGAHRHMLRGSPPIKIEAIYQFGDSLSDTGNLVIENPFGAHVFASFPYGESIGRPTGRCSDGLLMIDYFAQSFGLPPLNPSLNRQSDFSHGANFAVAGSTALNSSTLLAKNVISPLTQSSVSVQLDWFDSMCPSGSQCAKNIPRSLFVIETGGNDFNYALMLRKPIKEVEDMIPEVVAAVKIAVTRVIGRGATRVVVPGNFPIGCLPIYLSELQTEYPTRDNLQCLTRLNEFARVQNHALQQAIKEVQDEYPNTVVVYADYYSGLTWVLEHATDLGFENNNTKRACCGSGSNEYNFDLTGMCGTGRASVCATPARFVSWDGIHLTQRAYYHLAQWLLNQIVPALS